MLVDFERSKHLEVGLTSTADIAQSEAYAEEAISRS